MSKWNLISKISNTMLDWLVVLFSVKSGLFWAQTRHLKLKIEKEKLCHDDVPHIEFWHFMTFSIYCEIFSFWDSIAKICSWKYWTLTSISFLIRARTGHATTNHKFQRPKCCIKSNWNETILIHITHLKSGGSSIVINFATAP